jgi:hypothetical protein
MKMIIFDEKKYAEGLLEHGFVRFMSIKDLTALAKYWLSDGLSPHATKLKLEDFCLDFNPQYNKVISVWKIEVAIKNAKKYPLFAFSGIPICKGELDTINAVDNFRYEKVLFTMLVIARWQGMRKGNLEDSSHYVNQKISEVMTLSGVNIRLQERNDMLKYLNDVGLVDTALTGAYRLTYAHYDLANVALTITDYSHGIGSKHYPSKCEVCGEYYHRIAHFHKLCRPCYVAKRREDVRLNVQKLRQSMQ